MTCRWIPISIALLASAAPAHDQTAHLRLTQDALRHAHRLESALEAAGIDQTEYGLFEIEGVGYVLAASRAIGYWIPGQSAHSLIQAGTVLEDGVEVSGISWCNVFKAPLLCPLSTYGEFHVSRSANHFQDPYGKGSLGQGQAAGHWGFDGEGNGYTWLAAIESFTAGVLDADPEQRRRRLEHAFVALGCNLHLIQDQFSPAHTRDDPHPGHAIPFGQYWGGSSLLEDNEKRYILPLPYDNDFHSDSIELPSVGKHTDFFARASNWTCTRFFSDDTIFEDYPRPSQRDTTEQVPSCESGLFQKQYVRSILPETWSMKLASRSPLAWLNPDTGGYSLTGVPCDGTGAVPAVDRVIHDNLKRLVPQAVGYSAALLNHFFRGQIDAVTVPEGLRVTNRTQPIEATIIDGVSTHMDGVIRSGSLVVLVEFPDGQRQRIGHTDIPPGGLQPGSSIVVPHGPVPPLALRGGSAPVYVCLSGGWIGNEPAVLVARAEAAACDQVCSDPKSDPFFGTQVCPHGDLDGDGADDLLLVEVVDELPLAGPHSLQVRAWSPARCRELWTATYVSDWLDYTSPNARIGDLTGDGVEDWLARVVAAVGGSVVEVRSGRDGSFVRTLPALPSAVVLGAWAVTLPLDDVDADGFNDFATGNQFVSGWDGRPLLASMHSISFVTHRIGDMNGDGFAEFSWSGNHDREFMDGRTGTLATWPVDRRADEETTWLYQYTWAFPGDIDGDHIPDFIGQGLVIDFPAHVRIAALSGRTGAMIWWIDPTQPTGIYANSFGDHDGDGHEDLVMYVEDPLGHRTITAYSGVDGSPVADLSTILIDCFGGYNFSFLLLGDCNGDDRSDFFSCPLNSDVGCAPLRFGP